jgi:phage terminase large subunit GpA-like protein
MLFSDQTTTRPMIPSRKALRTELRCFVDTCRTPQLRTMRQFAEAEIIPPTGPFANLAFRCERQPASGAFFDLVDSGRWSRIFATGPSQAGKSLTCWVIPALYHLFELKETVICALPQMKMAHDKWTQDLLPVILKTRYAKYLPTSGLGSRGGDFDSIMFTNGVTLKFMSGGGDDKNRASFTSRVVVITEVDGMDEAGGTSREGDKISQIEARTNSYGSARRIYGECTLTTKQGRTYDEISKGTDTKLLVECRACHALVSPDREDLIGWQEADNEIDAAEQSAFACPDCGVVWSDDDRREAHKNLRCLHRGQEVDEEGQVVGDLPKTRTLGFRFGGFNNLLVKAGDLGIEEWIGSRSVDSDNAEKKLCQFFWALPYIPDKTDDVPLDALMIAARTNSFRRRLIPPGTNYISVGVDCGKWLHHWVAIAWLCDGTCQVIDYGTIKVESKDLGVERAMLKALREFRAIEQHGWENPDGTRRRADKVLVDSGYQTNEVYLFVSESGQGRYFAADGRGQSARKASSYQHPKAIGGTCLLLGEQYHVSLQDNGVLLLAMSSDYWKSYLHKRLSSPRTAPGSMLFFEAIQGGKIDPLAHLEVAKQLCAEKMIEETVTKNGLVKTIYKWVKTHRHNHYLDAFYMGCVGGHMCGYRLAVSAPVPQLAPPTPEPVKIDTGPSFVRKPTRGKEEKAGGWVRKRSS